MNWVTEPDGSHHSTASARRSRSTRSATATARSGSCSTTRGARAAARTSSSPPTTASRCATTTSTSPALINAGLKASASSDDVIVSNAGVALIHVKSRDPQKIHAIAKLLKTQPWAASIYTAAEAPVSGAYVKSPGDDHAATVEPYGLVRNVLARADPPEQPRARRRRDRQLPVVLGGPSLRRARPRRLPGRRHDRPGHRRRLRARLDEPVGHPQHPDGLARTSAAASAPCPPATPTSPRPCCGSPASR